MVFQSLVFVSDTVVYSKFNMSNRTISRMLATKAVDITETIVSFLPYFRLEPADIVAASFDGASTMSVGHGGVEALLKASTLNLLYVHCGSHLAGSWHLSRRAMQCRT